MADEIGWERQKEEEDRYRELFARPAQGGENAELANPHLLLVDVHADRDRHRVREETAEEKAIPHLFLPIPPAVSPVAQAVAQGKSAVVDRGEFDRRWGEFTHGLLNGVDWNNVFVAGGSVLRCIDSLAPQEDQNANKGSDIDVFLYGLSDYQANDKLKHIFEVVSRNAKESGVQGAVLSEAVRTKHAVTIVCQYPLRHVQIILRMYRSPAEVLMGFDIDCCSVGFDGKTVWALPRALRALTKRFNLVDLSRRSLTYEIRLFKYSKRNFHVLVPGYVPQQVDSGLYQADRPLRDVKGLAKLLLLDHRRDDVQSLLPKERKGIPKPDGYVDDAIIAQKGVSNRVEGEESDYVLVFVPWGPRWFLHRILNLLKLRDKTQFFARRQQNARDHSHVVVEGWGGVEQGTAKWCNLCRNGEPPSPAAEKGDDFIRGPITWLRDNPGRQGDISLLTGSFHPLSPADWERDAVKAYGGEKGVIPPRPVAVRKPAKAAKAAKAKIFAVPKKAKIKFPKAVKAKVAKKVWKDDDSDADDGDDHHSDDDDDEEEEEEEKGFHKKKKAVKAKAVKAPPKLVKVKVAKAIKGKGFGGKGFAKGIGGKGFGGGGRYGGPQAGGFGAPAAAPAGGGLFGAPAAAHAGGFGAPAVPAPAGGFGAGAGAAPVRGGFGGFGRGLGQAGGGFGRGIGHAGGGFGAARPAGGFGAAAPAGGFGAAAPAGGFGAAAPAGGFGAAAPAGGFGAAAGDNAFGGLGGLGGALFGGLGAAAENNNGGGGGGGGGPYFLNAPYLNAPAVPLPNYLYPAMPGLLPSGHPMPYAAPAPAPAHVGPAPAPGGPNKEFIEAFDNAAAKTSGAKLLLLLSLLAKGGKISPVDRGALKEKVIRGDENLLCALEVFEIDKDFDELADTFSIIAKL